MPNQKKCIVLVLGLHLVLFQACTKTENIEIKTNISETLEEEKNTEITSTSNQENNDNPQSMKSPQWEFIVNNAIREISSYAMNENPNAVFVGRDSSVDFIKQYDGEYEGRYLLKVVNRHNGNISLAMLLPLFDEYSSSESLDDESKLWRVTLAKYNGVEF